MELVLAGKVVSMFLAIFFGAPWIGMAFRGQAIAASQTFFVTVGIVGFVTLQWLL